MTALIVIGAILLFFLLLALLRVGVEFEYCEAGVIVRLRVGFLRLKLVPSKKKKVEAEIARKKKAEEPGKCGVVRQARELWPFIKKALVRLKRKLKIKSLTVHFTAAAADPALAAMMFGGGNVAMGMIIPVLENNFDIGKREFLTAVDYSADMPSVFVKAVLTLAVWQVIYIGLAFLIPYYHYLSANEQKESERAVQL